MAALGSIRMSSPHPTPGEEPTPSRPTLAGFKSASGPVLLIALAIVLILPGLLSIPFTVAMALSGMLTARDIPYLVGIGIPVALLCFLGFKLIGRAVR